MSQGFLALMKLNAAPLVTMSNSSVSVDRLFPGRTASSHLLTTVAGLPIPGPAKTSQ